MPHMERVYVQNLSPDTSIHMLSISGNTLHTHCSFFQDKVSYYFLYLKYVSFSIYTHLFKRILLYII